MTTPFPKTFFLTGIYEPTLAESEIHDVIVEGQIPEELEGTYYRNGPNPQYIFSDQYHLYDGDGMIHALSFHQGRVKYKNRWVKTDKFNLERQAQRALFSGFKQFGQSDESVKNKNSSPNNLNIIWHGDKLFALSEACQPIAINPNNCETIGEYNYHSELNVNITAHPCIHPKTGNMHCLSYINPPEMKHLYTLIINPQNKIEACHKISIPQFSLMHDFVITNQFTILPLFPLIADYQRLMSGGLFYDWQPTRPSYFGIMPHHSPDDIIWIETDPSFVFHFFNAYEEGDNIIIDGLALDELPDKLNAFADDSETFPAYLTRWILNRQSESVQKIRLDNTNGELLRIDERFIGHPYRYAYYGITKNESLPYSLLDGLRCYDFKTDTTQTLIMADDGLCLEPVFIPKSTSAKEGEGYLMSYVFYEKQNRSDLIILNAKDIASGPIATVKFPFRVPFGPHGNWVPHLYLE